MRILLSSALLAVALLLPRLAGAERSAPVPAPAASAEADFAAFQALRKSTPPSSPREMGRQGFAEWVEATQHKLIAAGLAFYERHPGDPRRWEVVQVLLTQNPPFVREYGPNFATQGMKDVVVDEAAKAAWWARLAELRQAMAAATDLPDGVREEMEWTAFARDFRAATAAMKAGQPVDWAAFRPRFDAHAAKFPAMDTVLVKRADDYLGALEKSVPGSAAQEWAHVLATTANAALRAAADGQLRRLEFMGKPLEIAFTAVDGRAVDLARLRGKVVLLDFWATWCGPCIAELPNVKAVHDKYHAQGFEVVAVSLDGEKDRQKLVDYVREQGLPWPQHYDGLGWKNEFAVRLGVRGIPAMFLLDQEGKVASTDARGPKLEREVRRLLKLATAPVATAGSAATPAPPAAAGGVPAGNTPPVALLAPGTSAPDFVSSDLSGQSVRVSEYRGRILILDFWATWCGPCIASMPHTQEVAARYADQGVVVLAVCTGDKRKRFEDWVRLKAKDYPGIRFTFDPHEQGSPAHDQRASWALYGVPAIPTQFIIDREGRIAGSTTGYFPGDPSLEKALSAAGVKVDPAVLAPPSRLAQARVGADGSTTIMLPPPARDSAQPVTPAEARRTAPPFMEKVAKLSAGEVVTDVDFRAADGTPRRLSDYRGRPLVLFFGTAEMIPADYLNSIVAKYGADRVQVLALVTRDTEAGFAAWCELHGSRGHRFAVAFDPVPVAEARNGVINRIFQFGAPTPFSLVIDAEGKFAGTFPWKLPQGQQGLAELLRRSGVPVDPSDLPSFASP
jgi:thiol-disulfide isomerase/thioredoxin